MKRLFAVSVLFVPSAPLGKRVFQLSITHKLRSYDDTQFDVGEPE